MKSTINVKKPVCGIYKHQSPIRIPMRVFVISGIAALTVLQGGCVTNVVDVRPRSERVSVAQATQVGQCQVGGVTTMSVLAKVGFYDRSVADVDADLLQLARNDAVDLGGDTLVKETRPAVGQETFKVYKCRPLSLSHR